jgi:phage shock protein A
MRMAANESPTAAVPEAGPSADAHAVVRRFAARGEEALHRIADLPGGSQAMRTLAELGRRVDEASRKARGIDTLEQRVAELERELAELRKPG